jgi:hypothetical protein
LVRLKGGVQARRGSRTGGSFNSTLVRLKDIDKRAAEYGERTVSIPHWFD